MENSEKKHIMSRASEAEEAAKTYIDSLCTAQNIAEDEIDEMIEQAEKCFALLSGQALTLRLINLGQQLEKGENSPHRTQKAIEFYEWAIRAGEPFGNELIGELYYRGNGVEKDYALAYDYFTRNEKKQICTRFFLGEMYRRGQFVKADAEKAVEYYRTLIDSDDWTNELDDYYAPACYFVANYVAARAETLDEIDEAAMLIEKVKEKYDTLNSVEDSIGFSTAEISKEDAARSYEKIMKKKEKLRKKFTLPIDYFEEGKKYYLADEPDYEKAIELFIKADELDEWRGTLMLAICSYFGYGFERNEKMAKEFLKRASERLFAQIPRRKIHEETNNFFSSDGLMREIEEDEIEFTRLAGKYDFPCGLFLNAVYFKDRNLGAADIKHAKELLEKTMELGYEGLPTSLYGELCYDHGEKEKGINYLRTAAALGIKAALRRLSMIYYIGDETIERDRKEAYYWLFKAAKRGDAKAQYLIACAYDEGEEFFPKDYIAAMAWFKESAENGFSNAMVILGRKYIAADRDDEGVELFEKASELGNPEGMAYLGSCYKYGYGCEMNLDKALNMYDKALAIFDDKDEDEDGEPLKAKVEKWKADLLELMTDDDDEDEFDFDDDDEDEDEEDDLEKDADNEEDDKD